VKSFTAHAGSLGEEPEHDLAADAVAAAGDDENLVAEVHD